MKPEARDVIELLKNQAFGILSTTSVEVEGFPFGSVTPYALDSHYQPLIFISDIAQHTKNILQDNRVSLIVLENSWNSATQDPQKNGRVTLLGLVREVSESRAESGQLYDQYFQKFPESASYRQAHGFSLFQIELVRIRFIGGFGKIFWLEPGELGDRGSAA